uniref:Uncharacterized protein n=1 Tax=Anguilla anguilla TaxID=7936 RepID=A0A0E9TCN4_ANGAN
MFNYSAKWLCQTEQILHTYSSSNKLGHHHFCTSLGFKMEVSIRRREVPLAWARICGVWSLPRHG